MGLKDEYFDEKEQRCLEINADSFKNENEFMWDKYSKGGEFSWS